MFDHRQDRIILTVPATFRRARAVARLLLSEATAPEHAVNLLEPLDCYTYALVLEGIASSGDAGSFLLRLAEAGGDCAARFLAQLVRKDLHGAVERPFGCVAAEARRAASRALREATLSPEARRLAGAGLELACGIHAEGIDASPCG
jgi:hypothetical protein